MKIKQLPTGAFEANCYILFDEKSSAVIVDPGDEAEAIISNLPPEAKLEAILLSHGHLDHISAVPELLEKFPGTPVYLHPADAAWAFTDALNIPPYTPIRTAPASLNTACTEGTLLTFGAMRLKVLETPGHTIGSICFLIEPDADNLLQAPILLSGDTLFKGSIGRTDFPTGDMSAMQSSLARLKALPPKTLVLSGHGPTSSVEIECAHNYYLQQSDNSLSF